MIWVLVKDRHLEQLKQTKNVAKYVRFADHHTLSRGNSNGMPRGQINAPAMISARTSRINVLPASDSLSGER